MCLTWPVVYRGIFGALFLLCISKSREHNGVFFALFVTRKSGYFVRFMFLLKGHGWPLQKIFVRIISLVKRRMSFDVLSKKAYSMNKVYLIVEVSVRISLLKIIYIFISYLLVDIINRIFCVFNLIL